MKPCESFSNHFHIIRETNPQQFATIRKVSQGFARLQKKIESIPVGFHLLGKWKLRFRRWLDNNATIGNFGLFMWRQNSRWDWNLWCLALFIWFLAWSFHCKHHAKKYANTELSIFFASIRTNTNPHFVSHNRKNFLPWTLFDQAPSPTMFLAAMTIGSFLPGLTFPKSTGHLKSSSHPITHIRASVAPFAIW